MTNYIIKRIIQAVLSIIVILTLLFFMLNLLPGDAALLAGDPRAARNPEVMERMRARWGLDQPLHIRYATYMSNLLRGDLGMSYRTGRTVNSLIAQSFFPTLQIVLFAFLLAAPSGVILGFIAAVRRGSSLDIGSMVFAIFGISAPRFWVGLMLMYLIAVNLRLLPATGYGGGSIRYMILPAITLALPLVALLARTTRAALLDVMDEDYVRTARSKGLSERVVQTRHILRNAVVSIITIAGLQLAMLMANTVIVEKVFSWPGMGSLVVDSVLRQDIPAVQGCIFVFALGFILINFIVDILYIFIDPRIKYGS